MYLLNILTEATQKAGFFASIAEWFAKNWFGAIMVVLFVIALIMFGVKVTLSADVSRSTQPQPKEKKPKGVKKE